MIDAGTVDLAAQKLKCRYSEPQRHYHTLEHISWMLRALKPDTLDQACETIELAVWFHDCVYDPVKGSPWNEDESICVWEDFADSTQSQVMADLKPCVSALIKATILHRLPDVLPEGLNALEVATFLDLDMGILSESAEAYEKYAHQIRQEYSHYPTTAYCAGRIKVLQSFFSRERIYLGYDADAMEKRARCNVEGEIGRLRSQETL
ncbi:hypothetical protein B0H15DRAFT_770210 [Mycena belliarum]|uniref:HD domain-containing protein n=1 Tax=Mycena belliarum TaxID=1033014 RepID=A0AAD6UFC8_9AGAR|nr:hypothetical protein B0H15DRAFT_770210 [Mycena belliae]